MFAVFFVLDLMHFAISCRRRRKASPHVITQYFNYIYEYKTKTFVCSQSCCTQLGTFRYLASLPHKGQSTGAWSILWLYLCTMLKKLTVCTVAVLLHSIWPHFVVSSPPREGQSTCNWSVFRLYPHTTNKKLTVWTFAVLSRSIGRVFVPGQRHRDVAKCVYSSATNTANIQTFHFLFIVHRYD